MNILTKVHKAVLIKNPDGSQELKIGDVVEIGEKEPAPHTDVLKNAQYVAEQNNLVNTINKRPNIRQNGEEFEIIQKYLVE